MYKSRYCGLLSYPSCSYRKTPAAFCQFPYSLCLYFSPAAAKLHTLTLNTIARGDFHDHVRYRALCAERFTFGMRPLHPPAGRRTHCRHKLFSGGRPRLHPLQRHHDKQHSSADFSAAYLPYLPLIKQTPLLHGAVFFYSTHSAGAAYSVLSSPRKTRYLSPSAATVPTNVQPGGGASVTCAAP